jgi:hypothetical protein
MSMNCPSQYRWVPAEPSAIPRGTIYYTVITLMQGYSQSNGAEIDRTHFL